MSDLEQGWDIRTNVGFTALAVAAVRAGETRRADRLIEDPYAEAFVATAGSALPLPLDEDGFGDGALGDVWRWMSVMMAVRTRHFDDYFARATAAGIDQIVLVAAGLDSRAYRLPWPAGTTVFEVDQPRVLEFKQQVLDQSGAVAGCERRVVAADLRDDWADALTRAGFDPNRRTAWLAEGLLLYLPAQAEDELFDHMEELSAPGSRIAVEKAPAGVLARTAPPPRVTEAADELGFDVTVLWNGEARRDCADRLRAAGWSVESTTLSELGARLGRPVPDNDVTAWIGTQEFVSAINGEGNLDP